MRCLMPLSNNRGVLSAEIAIVAGASVVVMVVVSVILTFLVTVASFDSACGEVARSLSDETENISSVAQTRIERALGFQSGSNGMFHLSSRWARQSSSIDSRGVVTFVLKFQPFVSSIGVGRLKVDIPAFVRQRSYSVVLVDGGILL